MNLYVLTITHRHGINIRVFKSEDGAFKGLLEYIRKWAGDCRNNEAELIEALKSGNRKAAINLYFSEDGKPNEYYSIEKCELED